MKQSCPYTLRDLAEYLEKSGPLRATELAKAFKVDLVAIEAGLDMLPNGRERFDGLAGLFGQVFPDGMPDVEKKLGNKLDILLSDLAT